MMRATEDEDALLGTFVYVQLVLLAVFDLSSSGISIVLLITGEHMGWQGVERFACPQLLYARCFRSYIVLFVVATRARNTKYLCTIVPCKTWGLLVLWLRLCGCLGDHIGL